MLVCGNLQIARTSIECALWSYMNYLIWVLCVTINRIYWATWINPSIRSTFPPPIISMCKCNFAIVDFYPFALTLTCWAVALCSLPKQSYGSWLSTNNHQPKQSTPPVLPGHSWLAPEGQAGDPSSVSESALSHSDKQYVELFSKTGLNNYIKKIWTWRRSCLKRAQSCSRAVKGLNGPFDLFISALLCLLQHLPVTLK